MNPCFFHTLPAQPCRNHCALLWSKMMFPSRSHPHWLVCIWFRQGWPRPRPGANLTGDMLLGPVVFISREKSKWLGQEFRCVPAAEHGICKTCVSAGWRSSQGWRAASVCVRRAVLGHGPKHWEILKLGSNSWSCQGCMAPWGCRVVFCGEFTITWQGSGCQD